MDNEWHHIMEQIFILKYHGNYSLFEQSLLTAEERKIIIERIDKEHKAENTPIQSIPKPHIPHMPHMPSIPKPHR